MTEPSKTKAANKPAGPAEKSPKPGNGSGADQSRLNAGGANSRHPEQPENAAHRLSQMRHDPAAIRRAFETGEYPYRQKLRRTVYEKHKAELQVELLKVQEWVKATGQKIVVLFEGRDAAGKGGTIKRFTEHLNPRGAQRRWRSTSPVGA